MSNTSTTIENPQPNADTIAAIEEVQKMKCDSSIGKTYEDIAQIMEELF